MRSLQPHSVLMCTNGFDRNMLSGLLTGRCAQYVQHVAGPLLSYLEKFPRLSLPAEGIVLAHVWLLLCCNMADTPLYNMLACVC